MATLTSRNVTEQQLAGLAWACDQYNENKRIELGNDEDGKPKHVDLTPAQYWDRVVTQGALNSYMQQAGIANP